MSPFLKLSAAGFAATAISYGPARMGFGLFLAQFKEGFGISTTAAGLISAGGFAGFLLGLIGAYAATAWRGPRLPVILGLRHLEKHSCLLHSGRFSWVKIQWILSTCLGRIRKRTAATF